MTAADVISLYTELENLKITVWVDGGWGVDALLGEQTRPHQDLDIAVQEGDVPRLRHLLQERGYRDIKPEEARPWNFVLGDENGREIDLHVIVLDDHGNGLYGPTENGQMYPAAALTGAGSIKGRIVRCISPQWMVKFHKRLQTQREGLLGRLRFVQKVRHRAAGIIRSVQDIESATPALLFSSNTSIRARRNLQRGVG